MAFRHCRLLICHGWIASAGTAGSVMAQRTMPAALLLLQCVGGRGGCCCCSTMQNFCMAWSCPCVDAIVKLWALTDSCVAAYVALKFAIDLPYNTMELPVKGHAVAMHASGYRRLVDKHDFCGTKRLECVKRLDNSGAFGFAGDPCLIFLGIHAALLDDAEAHGWPSCIPPVNRWRMRVSNPLA
jgi:hypothetical protein